MSATAWEFSVSMDRIGRGGPAAKTFIVVSDMPNELTLYEALERFSERFGEWCGTKLASSDFDWDITPSDEKSGVVSVGYGRYGEGTYTARLIDWPAVTA